MQKWEYLVAYLQSPDVNETAVEMGADWHMKADKYTEQLNKFASGGWELMHFEWDGEKGAKAIFKRPRG